MNSILGLMKSIPFFHVFHILFEFVDYFHIDVISIVLESSSDTIEVDMELIIETIHIIFVDKVVMLYLKPKLFIQSKSYKTIYHKK